MTLLVSLISFFCVALLWYWPDSERKETNQALTEVVATLPKEKKEKKVGLTPIKRQKSRLTVLLKEADKQSYRLITIIAILGSCIIILHWGLSWQMLGALVLFFLLLASFFVLNQKVFKRREREEKVKEQLPNLLMHLASQALLTADLEALIYSAHTKAEQPVKSYLSETVEYLKIGHSVEEALERTIESSYMPAFNDLCMVLLFYAKYGGDLQKALVVLRAHLMNHARAQTLLKKKTTGLILTGVVLQSLNIVMAANAWASDEGIILALLNEQPWIFYTVMILLVGYWLTSWSLFSWLRRL